MPATGFFLTFLFATLLAFAPVAAHSAGANDLDVTIRMIDRQSPDIDAFINRIEPPATRPAGVGERPRSEGSRDAGRQGGNERSRDRDRVERSDRGDRGSPGGERQQAADIAESAREARDRRWDVQRDTRDDIRDGGGRRFRND